MQSFLRVLTVSGVTLLVGVFSACGSGADAPPQQGGTGGVGTGGSGLGGTQSGGSGGIVIDAEPDAPDGLNPDAACADINESGNATPLHLYILLDKSSSMNSSNLWGAAVAGITAFVSDPQSNGIYVGLKFFPRAPGGTECDFVPYETPDTPFDILPTNKDPIIQAINAESPNGLSTPTYVALNGALVKGIQIAQNNPGHTSAVLLVTDGIPQEPATDCAGVDPNDPNEVANLAATAAAHNPSVLTFVIGLPGVNQAFANQVAQAGGTTSAILVSSTNVQQEFTDALSKVRGQALPCEYELPADLSSGKYDTKHVNAQITPSSGTPELLYQGDCAAGGDWYYDNDTNPTKIELCPNTCSTLKSDFAAHIEFTLGCATRIK